MPIVLTELLAVLGPWIMRFFAAKAIIAAGWFLARLGLVLATGKYLVEPALDALQRTWGMVPTGFQCWFSAIGITPMVSICVSGLTLIGLKRVFFAKKD